MTDRLIRADAVVIGGGVAGLATVLATTGEVVLLSKAPFGEGGSTPWAQGGVASAVDDRDSPGAHAADTVRVGAGLTDRSAAETLAFEGPARVRELIELGAQFDRDPAGRLLLGREAGHSMARILHANGDATGAEMMRAMSVAVSERPNVEVHDRTFAVDLVVSDGRVIGVEAVTTAGESVTYVAPAVVLATGGVGRVYARTTNPVEVTGDGLAMAARAGARLVDLEFVQFHPTALASHLDPLPLLTEALRGAGARLIDEAGHRYMADVHPDAELAPRDVVARATWAQLEAGGVAYLDASDAVGAEFPDLFPTVFASARAAGIDPRRDPLPITPAAHYHMGGIAVDGFGRSSIPGLWAVGEAASTGVHGANRLASNSLLEGLVFGARVAASIGTGLLPRPVVGPIAAPELGEEPDVIAEVRSLMWQNAGVVRDGDGLAAAIERLRGIENGLGGLAGETANIVLAARLIASTALDRRESRGAHYRSDYPETAATARRAYVEPALAEVR